MDPNQALEDLRRLSKKIDTCTGEELNGVALEMALTFDGLDEWLSRMHGSLPREWDHS